jgi:hypothetical protein
LPALPFSLRLRSIVVALTQALDLALQGIKPPGNVPPHILDDPGPGRHTGAVEGPVPAVAGGDAALRGEQIGASGILVPPDNGLVEGSGRTGRQHKKGEGAPMGDCFHGDTSGM